MFRPASHPCLSHGYYCHVDHYPAEGSGRRGDVGSNLVILIWTLSSNVILTVTEQNASESVDLALVAQHDASFQPGSSEPPRWTCERKGGLGAWENTVDSSLLMHETQILV